MSGWRRTWLAAGAVLLSSAGLWHFGLAKRWTQRLPPGWRTNERYLGTMTYADPATGRLPERDVLTEYDRLRRVLADSGRAGSVVVEDRFVVREIATGQVVWEYVTTARADPRTGTHLAAAYRDDIIVFPRNVERRTYRWRTNYVQGIPLAFERTERVDDLETYVFAYRGRAEYTESYAGTIEYPGVPVLPGQEIRCADDRFSYRVWVEPTTGEQVKLEEACPSGDYIYDTATGARLRAVARWSGVTAGDALIERIAEVRRLRTAYRWTSRYIPASFAATGLLALALGLRRRAPGPSA